MQLTWNGTGSAWSNVFGNSSAVLEQNGQRLLIDCGHTVPGRLKQMGLSLRDLDGVFLSHLHGDHIYGLEEWGFRNFLEWNIKPRLFIAEDLALPLWKHILSGTMAQVCDQTCLLRDYFQVTPMQIGTPVTFGPWQLEIHLVRHVPHARAYGLKVTSDHLALGFTCDSLADADPWFYENTTRVFHDCNFNPYFSSTVHAHFEQLREYPLAFREKTWLVHYDDSLAEKRANPDWQAALAATQMHLTEPYVAYKF